MCGGKNMPSSWFKQYYCHKFTRRIFNALEFSCKCHHFVLQTAFKNWQKFHDNHERCDLASSQIDSILRTMGVDNLDPRLKHVYDQKDMMRTQSHWLVGGDGWAYDIG